MKFIEGKLGCSPNIMGRDSGSAANMPCYSGDHLTKLATLSRQLYEADDTGIYDLTGCMSACEKDKFEVILGHGEEPEENGEVLLTFTINDRFSSEEEQGWWSHSLVIFPIILTGKN